MRKHLGWMARLLIAAAGIGFILYTLEWTDRVELPPGYVLTPDFQGGADGQSFVVKDETDQAYLIGPPQSDPAKPTASQWIAKSVFVAGDAVPRFKPSFLTILRQSNGPMLLAGLGLFAPAFMIGAARWAVLMRARGIDAGFVQTYRLTMAGLFFNLCMPGTTGGDVMKAFYAAKSTHQRADAVVSIAIDRVCGLVGLLLLVSIVGLFSLDDPMIRRITLGMWIALMALALIAGVYVSKTLRARIRLGGLIGKLPGAGLARKLDALVAAYRNHPRALAAAITMSVPIHLCLALAMTLAGYALGVDRPMLYLLGTVPIVLLLWSLPVSGPLGLGPLDIVAVQLIIAGSDISSQLVVMMFVAYRLYAVALGLAGSLAMFGSGGLSLTAARAAASDTTNS